MNKGDWYNYMYTKYKGRGYGNTATNQSSFSTHT